MAGALDGIRVIDFGQYIAGPLVGMLLADQGADVIKVDPPGGPRWKTPANATWNRGKRSIVLDLKQVDDLATAKGLVQGADVVVENFRPGVMDRLGLGATAMTQANPRLVYLSLPGFASDDPAPPSRPGKGFWAPPPRLTGPCLRRMVPTSRYTPQYPSPPTTGRFRGPSPLLWR